MTDFETLVRGIVREELAKLSPSSEYLSTESAAEVADVSTATIRRWVRERKLPEHRAGRRVRVLRADLERLLAAGVRRTLPDAKLTPEQRAMRDAG